MQQLMICLQKPRSQVLHSFKAYFKVRATKNEPVANKIDGNIQFYVLSHIPDNFQGETEMVFDRLPKSSRHTLLLMYLICKEN